MSLSGFSRTRWALEEMESGIREQLAQLRLCAHPRKTRIVRSAQGMTFVGYRITDRGPSLPRATVTRFHRHLHALQRAHARGEPQLDRVRAAVSGLLGHARPAGAERVLGMLLLETHAFCRPSTAGVLAVPAPDDPHEAPVP